MIIITTQCFYPKIGGIEALMTGMAENLSSIGKDVLVLADGSKDTKEDENQKYSIKRFNGWKPLRRLNKARYLEEICKRENVEIVYADSWKSIEHLNKKNKKILVLAHGTEIPKQYWTLMIDTLRFKKKESSSLTKMFIKLLQTQIIPKI